MVYLDTNVTENQKNLWANDFNWPAKLDVLL